MNYFSVSFLYRAAQRGVSVPGLHISFSVDEEAETEKLFAAEKKVKTLLDKENLEFRHEYSYPDGSLYRFVRSELSQNELEDKLKALLPDIPCNVFLLNDGNKIEDAKLRFNRPW